MRTRLRHRLLRARRWLRLSARRIRAVTVTTELLLLTGGTAEAAGAPPYGTAAVLAAAARGLPRRGARDDLTAGLKLPGRLLSGRQTLEMRGMMGQHFALQFQREGWRLPDWSALQSGAVGTTGRGKRDQRLELTADRLSLAGSATLGAQWLRLTGGRGSGERLALSLKSGKESKGLSLALETGHVDHKFEPGSNVKDDEKKLFARERGFRWQEISAHLQPARWTSVENSLYRSRSEDGKRERLHDRLYWSLAPFQRGKLLLQRDRVAEQDRPGHRTETTTQSLQWEETLGSGIALRAGRETVRTEEGQQPRTRARDFWSLRANPRAATQWALDRDAVSDTSNSTRTLNLSLSRAFGKALGFRGQYRRADTGGKDSQESYETSLTGALGKRWQMTAAALQFPAPGGRPPVKQTLALTGPEGVLGAVFRKTRVSFALTAADRLPMALVRIGPPSRAGSRATRPGHAASDWNSASVLTETKLRGSTLLLGLQSYDLPGGGAGGLSYWWRSTAKQRLQWEVRRNWLELPDGRLVPRQRLAASYGWARHRLAASLELNPEPAPGKPTIGQRRAALDFQTQVGTTTMGIGYGLTEDLSAQVEATLRRFWIETALSHKGQFRLTYEDRDAPASSAFRAAAPDHLIALALRQEVAPDRRIDLQAELRQWHAPHPHDLTWRLDLQAAF